MSQEDVQKLATEMTKALVDNGQIIEAGWVGLRLAAIPQNAPQVQLDAMREAFFAGANHLLSSMMVVLDPGREPTENDLRRVSLIYSELDEFIKQFKAKHQVPHH